MQPNLSLQQSSYNMRSYGIDSHWLKDASAPHRLLMVYAHPDDETFGNAGTILHYRSAGVAVHLICATRGESGEVSSSFLEGYADIAARRTAELSCAAQVLGLASFHFLGYRDSGMPNAPENRHPDALIQASPRRIAGQITAIIRALRPQVIVTFGPYGGYGHPDHIAIHHAAFRAFAAANDPFSYPEQLTAGLAPWLPTKLYYQTFGTRLIALNVLALRLLGRDPHRLGENGDIDLVQAGINATPITTTIDASAHQEGIEQAWRCHHSQLDGMPPQWRLPAFIRRRIFGKEHFTRVVPSWEAGTRREDDLFTALKH